MHSSSMFYEAFRHTTALYWNIISFAGVRESPWRALTSHSQLKPGSNRYSPQNETRRAAGGQQCVSNREWPCNNSNSSRTSHKNWHASVSSARTATQPNSRASQSQPKHLRILTTQDAPQTKCSSHVGRESLERHNPTSLTVTIRADVTNCVRARAAGALYAGTNWQERSDVTGTCEDAQLVASSVVVREQRARVELVAQQRLLRQLTLGHNKSHHTGSVQEVVHGLTTGVATVTTHSLSQVGRRTHSLLRASPLPLPAAPSGGGPNHQRVQHERVIDLSTQTEQPGRVATVAMLERWALASLGGGCQTAQWGAATAGNPRLKTSLLHSWISSSQLHLLSRFLYVVDVKHETGIELCHS